MEHEVEVRTLFDSVAHRWPSKFGNDASFAIRPDRFLTVLRSRLETDADVLDFGCGSGEITRHLARAGYSTTGCDASAAMIDVARNSDPEGLVKWLALPEKQTSTALPFESCSFDAIVASSVLEYVHCPERMIMEFYRVLRPGGWLFATVPDVRHVFRRRERWVRLFAGKPGLSSLLRLTPWREGFSRLALMINFLRPEAWVEMMQKAGLTVEPADPAADPLLLLAANRHAVEYGTSNS